MTELEVKRKLDEAIQALEEYQKNLDTKKGLWFDDIKRNVEIITEKSHVLNAAGRVCSACQGTGRL